MLTPNSSTLKFTGLGGATVANPVTLSGPDAPPKVSPNPAPYTPNTTPQTLNFSPYTSKPTLYTLNTKHRTVSIKHSTLTPDAPAQGIKPGHILFCAGTVEGTAE